MRAQMNRVVDGKQYNTETADLVASDEYWDGSNYARQGRNRHLYKTAKGAFFLGHSTQWQGEHDRIVILTKKEAKALYEQLPEISMTYEETFGEAPEEA